MSKPFLPSDLPKPDPLKLWRRGAAILAIAKVRGETIDDVARGCWSNEPGAMELALKAASSPLSSVTGGATAIVGQAVTAFLQGLAPTSAAARLFAACARFPLEGAAKASMPRFAAGFPDAVFVGEGMPTPRSPRWWSSPAGSAARSS